MTALTRQLLLPSSLLLALPVTLAAQGLTPTIPLNQTEDAFVSDAGNDSVFRLQDTNYDGDYNDPGEVVLFYDEDQGTILLGNNNGVAVDLAGHAFVSDTSSDIILRFLDTNGDGDAHDAGEHYVFFDGDPLVNLSGLEMVSPSNLAIDTLGRVWIAEANNGGGGIDSILRLWDLNGDGDANDGTVLGLGNEAIRYYEPVTTGSVGDSIPNSVVIGQDGHIYYMEGGATGFISKGVYRLNDADGSGTIDPATEVAPFFIPPTLPGNPFMWSFAQDPLGYFFAADTGNDVIWRFRDNNGDNFIDNSTETDLWWVAPGSSLIWELQVGSDGSLLVAESQSPDRIVRMRDDNFDGKIDPVTEVTEVYSELVSAVNISNPRGLTWIRKPTLTGPASPPVGGNMTLLANATEGDALSVHFSLGLLPQPFLLAPLGLIEIDFLTALNGFLFTSFIPASGFDATVLPVPVDPILIGTVVYFQGVAGTPARFSMTNTFQTIVGP